MYIRYAKYSSSGVVVVTVAVREVFSDQQQYTVYGGEWLKRQLLSRPILPSLCSSLHCTAVYVHLLLRIPTGN